MTDRYVLDTDAVVDVLRGRQEVIARLAAVSPDDVAVTTMTLAELLYGVAVSSNSERNAQEVERFVSRVRVLPFSREAAMRHAIVRHAVRAQPIGPNDLIVAATALAAGATLVTSNSGEFSRVPGLAIENWRARL